MKKSAFTDKHVDIIVRHAYDNLQEERAKKGPKLLIWISLVLWVVPIVGVAVAYVAVMRNQNMLRPVRMFFAVLALMMAVGATTAFFIERDARQRYESLREQDQAVMHMLLESMNEWKVDRPTQDI